MLIASCCVQLETMDSKDLEILEEINQSLKQVSAPLRD